MRLEEVARRVMRRLERVKPSGAVNFPIEVKWGSFRHCADTGFDEDRKVFVIRLSRKRLRTRDEVVDTLIHEKAHVLVWFSAPTHHGPEWGIAYARLYRAFHGVR